MCHSFLPVFNSTSDVFCVYQKSYARQVKLSCLPYVYYICKQYVAARARNFQTFLGRLWFVLLILSCITEYMHTESYLNRKPI